MVGRPPPVDITDFSFNEASSRTKVSTPLKYSSPRLENIFGIDSCSYNSISSSRSIKVKPFFLDISFPTVVLPVQENPVKYIFCPM